MLLSRRKNQFLKGEVLATQGLAVPFSQVIQYPFLTRRHSRFSVSVWGRPSTAQGLTANDQVSTAGRAKYFISAIASKPLLDANWRPVQRVPGALSPGVVELRCMKLTAHFCLVQRV
jgi:hypothetical protein